MTYSLFFRKKVMSYKAKHGLTFEQTSAYFKVSKTALVRWNRKLEPQLTRNRPSKVNYEDLIQDVLDNPDSYQYERAKKFGVSQCAIYRAFKKIGITFKKNSKTYQIPKYARKIRISKKIKRITK